MRKKANYQANAKGAWVGVRSRMLFLEKRLADYLNQKCRNISSKGLLAMLITFTVVVSMLLLRLIISSI